MWGFRSPTTGRVHDPSLLTRARPSIAWRGYQARDLLRPAGAGRCVLSARRASEADPWTPVKLSEQPYKRTIGRAARAPYDGFGGPVCDMIYDEDHLAGRAPRAIPIPSWP
ncbi:MAG: hypothetical protein ACLU0O_01855 [Collinsella sp.]